MRIVRDRGRYERWRAAARTDNAAAGLDRSL